MVKILSDLAIERNFLNLVKNIYKNPTADVILNDKKLEAFPPRTGTRK